jgi:spermidine synthase
MNETQANQPSNLTDPKHSISLLIVLFAGSGCAALIYEIVWFQMLQLVVGSSAVSLAVVLGTFMGGMCLGSLALPRIVSDRVHPLKVYALLELGIGVIGLLVLFVMPSLGRIYTSIGGYGASGILLRGMVAGICLLPPTIMMGATLPAIARWVETTPLGISRLGFFYGANIGGAVLGSLLAGFYLLRIHDMAIASYVAAAINLSVALISLLLARARLYRPPVADAPEATVFAAPGSGTVYIAIALSGLCALGAQVVWSRLLSLMFGGTVYTLSIILAVFLVGLGVGSSVGSMRARWSKHPRLELGVCQLSLIAAIAWSAYMLTRSLPYWPIDPTMALSPWFNFQMDVFRCAWAILPAACLWGASFPLALAAAASRGSDAGKLVGGIYAANTVGAIVGATTFSLIVITVWDTQRAQQALIGLSALAALLTLAPVVWPFRNNKFDLRVGASVAVTFLVAVMLILSVPPVPGPLVAYGRSLPRVLALRDAETKERFVPNILYVGEGLNASVAVSEISGRSRNFHVSGKIEASTLPRDMRLQRMLGHLPALNHPQPRSVHRKNSHL